MLRRNSSNRLSRSKSSSSVQNKHESIDPTVARQHAHAAATLAFARAQERTSADLSHRGGNPRGNPSSHSDAQPYPQHHNLTSIADGGGHVIKRQVSVRFVGPNAVQTRQSISTRASQNPIRSQTSSATLRPVAMTTNAPVPAAYRPPSRSSSIGKASAGRETAESYVTALAAYDEYYTREDDVVSTPSSYRRIRRSKSMFTPVKAPNVFYTNGTPNQPVTSYFGGQSSSEDPQDSQNKQSHAPLRVQKSMSFLRIGRHAARERNDEAVQIARDRFFQQTAQQRLREQPSFLFQSKLQKQEKPFRKSVRSSSANSMAIASANQNIPLKESSLKVKVRKASKSLKSKLKRVLGFSKDEPVHIPNQQIDARETHVREYAGDSNVARDHFFDIPHPDEASLLRVASRIPSLRGPESNEHLSSQCGSLQSLKSEHSDNKSRVTSWNSSVPNTVTSQALRAHADRELQRLSIINENGTHISSSSFKRDTLPNQFSAYPVIHRQSKSVSNVPIQVTGPVDSARVYSALMKRLDENSPNPNLSAPQRRSLENFAASNQVLQSASSINSSRGNRTPATIRHVPQEDTSDVVKSRESSSHENQRMKAGSIHYAEAEDMFRYTETDVHHWVAADPLREAQIRSEDDVFAPKDAANNGYNTILDQQRGRGESNTSAAAGSYQTSSKTSYYTAPEHIGLTPQQQALRNEPFQPGQHKGLREARSTFFGGSSVTIARTTSPFRRAMTEGEYNSTVLAGGVDRPSSVAQRNPLYMGPGSSIAHISGDNEDKESQIAYSESVYSRTTSGQNPAANSALSLLPAEQASETPSRTFNTGDVVIIDRATYRPVVPSNGHRVTSSEDSIEWKKWMSSEVSKLERTKENSHAVPYINYALPTMPKSFQGGHVRESAQISNDDVDVAQRKVSTVKQPLGIVQQNHNVQNPPFLRPILKNRSAISLVENVTPTFSIPIPPPPPIPPLRPTPSKSSLGSIGTASAPNSAIKVSSLSGRNLLHKRKASTATLRSTKSVETPAKLVKKNGRPSPYISKPQSPGNGLTAAVEKQFGSTSTRSRIPGITSNRENENLNGRQEKDDVYGTDGAGLMGPGLGELSEKDAQAMGSKRMVDLFLSSRRRRIAGGSEESGMFI